MNNFSLNGTWSLRFFPETSNLPSSPYELDSFNLKEITAEVPGNVEIDLVNAGIEKDPFYDENLYNFRKYEFYQWWFTRHFEFPYTEGSFNLVFEGINTFATVWINGILIGSSDNMLVAHSFCADSSIIKGGDNRIDIRIESAVNKARNFDYPAMIGGAESGEYSMLRMPPHSFGWDIMPRLLSAGMWRGIRLEQISDVRIRDVYYAVRRTDNNSASLYCNYLFSTDTDNLDGYEVEITGNCGDSCFKQREIALFTHGSADIHIDNARLWWPSGYGEQNLYNVTFSLYRFGRPLCRKSDVIGLRTFEIEHRLLPGDEGEFKVMVNGVPVLCKGSNHVPLDALHSRDAGRYEAATLLYRDIGCNIIRCWGGNVYEDNAFYSYCDRFGIMVWQDFSMACSTYPQTADFFAKIESEAEKVVRKLRNHPSILLWAGDNEVDEVYVGMDFVSSSNKHNEITREILPRVIRNHDPYRFFLPSSPYIPDNIKRYFVPEQHNWGARAYFKDDFYKHSNAHFISEAGYHGCPSPGSLRRFIPEDKLSPRLGNSSWSTHDTDYLLSGERGYNRINLMTDQVEILCGEVPEDLETFSIISQLSQAEAKKFFIEHTRIKKWRRTGIIWWNMLDGWPQISDAIVDYYFDKKLAYYWLKRVHQPICLMLDELTDWGHNIILGNDSRESRNVKWKITDSDDGSFIAGGEVLSEANKNMTVGNIREISGTRKLYLLSWEIDGNKYYNHYISGFPHYPKETLLKWIETIKKSI